MASIYAGCAAYASGFFMANADDLVYTYRMTTILLSFISNLTGASFSR